MPGNCWTRAVIFKIEVCLLFWKQCGFNLKLGVYAPNMLEFSQKSLSNLSVQTKYQRIVGNML